MFHILYDSILSGTLTVDVFHVLYPVPAPVPAGFRRSAAKTAESNIRISLPSSTTCTVQGASVTNQPNGASFTVSALLRFLIAIPARLHLRLYIVTHLFYSEVATLRRQRTAAGRRVGSGKEGAVRVRTDICGNTSPWLWRQARRASRRLGGGRLRRRGAPRYRYIGSAPYSPLCTTLWFVMLF
jgi:hypothetical protein